MKLFVGLGNPGKEYEQTRHNAGYLLLDKIAETEKYQTEEKFQSQIFTKREKGEQLIFVKPLTFMNLSGEAVSKIMEYYKVEISELVVLMDDVDVPLGQARVRLSGSSAGHKGLQNVIDALGSNIFARVRIGIGDEPVRSTEHDKFGSKIETKEYVLGKFTTREKKILEDVVSMAAEYLKSHIGSIEEIKATTLETKL